MLFLVPKLYHFPVLVPLSFTIKFGHVSTLLLLNLVPTLVDRP